MKIFFENILYVVRLEPTISTLTAIRSIQRANAPATQRIFQRQLSIIKFTLNYPPIRNNLTSASLLSMLIETDYLNYPPIRNNLSSTSLPLSCAGAILKILQYLIKCFRSMTMASLLSMLIETDYNFKKITTVFFGSCLKEFHSVWYCLFVKQNAKLFQHSHLLFETCWGYLFCSIRLSPGCCV